MNSDRPVLLRSLECDYDAVDIMTLIDIEVTL